jgi:hypothetical protein
MPTYRNDGTFTTKLVNYKGKEVVMYPGVTIETHEVLGAPFTKISEEPFYSLTEVYGSVDVPDHISGLKDCKVIRVISGSVAVIMHINAASNTKVLHIPASTMAEFKNDGLIHTLFFSKEEESDDTSVIVEGYLESPPTMQTLTTAPEEVFPG